MRETTFRKPYIISWLAIPALILLGIVFRQHTIDIQLADTYYVIGKLNFVFVAALFLLLLGVGYWLVSRNGKIPNKTLTSIHLLLTLMALVTFALPLPDSNWLVWGAMALVVSQLVYIINILITLLSSAIGKK